jgi:hypothetical protein
MGGARRGRARSLCAHAHAGKAALPTGSPAAAGKERACAHLCARAWHGTGAHMAGSALGQDKGGAGRAQGSGKMRGSVAGSIAGRGRGRGSCLIHCSCTAHAHFPPPALPLHPLLLPSGAHATEALAVARAALFPSKNLPQGGHGGLAALRCQHLLLRLAHLHVGIAPGDLGVLRGRGRGRGRGCRGSSSSSTSSGSSRGCNPSSTCTSSTTLPCCRLWRSVQHLNPLCSGLSMQRQPLCHPQPIVPHAGQRRH